MLTLIAAVAANGAIGYHNRLLYWLPNDLRRFKSLTTGHTIIMGRRTFESLPKGALPDRRNMVLSRNASFAAPGAEVFPSLEEALAACTLPPAPGNSAAQVRSDGKVRCGAAWPAGETFVIGGERVYRAAMPLADRLCLTLVADSPALADAFFPEVAPETWNLVKEEHHEADERHAFAYTFADYVRRLP